MRERDPDRPDRDLLSGDLIADCGRCGRAGRGEGEMWLARAELSALLGTLERGTTRRFDLSRGRLLE